MKLEYINIRNFRSIEEVKIELTPSCRILVGINESGKSNILKALSSLGEYMPSDKEDIREPLQDEDPIGDSFIRFVFSLNKEEIERLYESLSQKVFSKNLIKTPIVKRGNQTLNLKSFIGLESDALYKVDVKNQKKYECYWGNIGPYELINEWKKPSSQCPEDFEIDKNSTEKLALNILALVKASDFPEIPPEYLAPATFKDLWEVIGLQINNITSDSLPKTLFWQYSEKNLLPSSISIDSFIADPNVCLPLKSMFLLAGINNIAEAVTEARKKSRNSLHNFFKNVADKTTTHFRNVWKEHKTIEFELIPDGEDIIPGVREKNRYDFSKRSDGFKRFVSFLLLISAKVKSGALTDTLLLTDEPDTSLHPSGARFLREELIRISRTNYVVFSTHSIFMIDRENIGRHIIVTKKNEKTTISKANDSNIADEEVIFNALGYSIFESLQRRNIIFEGWKDKHLFQTATKKMPSTYSELKGKFKDVGLCHAKGVKHIKSITPIMELAQRECLIISDSDKPARDKQSEYISLNGYGKWLRYDEVLNSGPPIKTGEDFLKPEVFRSPIKDVKKKYPSLPDFDETRMNDSQGKLYVIDEWLRLGGLDNQTKERELKVIKDQVFENLRVSNIEDSYFLFLKKLAEFL